MGFGSFGGICGIRGPEKLCVDLGEASALTVGMEEDEISTMYGLSGQCRPLKTSMTKTAKSRNNARHRRTLIMDHRSFPLRFMSIVHQEDLTKWRADPARRILHGICISTHQFISVSSARNS
jgi:hypothetical protein